MDDDVALASQRAMGQIQRAVRLLAARAKKGTRGGKFPILNIGDGFSCAIYTVSEIPRLLRYLEGRRVAGTARRDCCGTLFSDRNALHRTATARILILADSSEFHEQVELFIEPGLAWDGRTACGAEDDNGGGGGSYNPTTGRCAKGGPYGRVAKHDLGASTHDDARYTVFWNETRGLWLKGRGP